MIHVEQGSVNSLFCNFCSQLSILLAYLKHRPGGAAFYWDKIKATYLLITHYCTCIDYTKKIMLSLSLSLSVSVSLSLFFQIYIMVCVYFLFLYGTKSCVDNIKLIDYMKALFQMPLIPLCVNQTSLCPNVHRFQNALVSSVTPPHWLITCSPFI